jgi:monoamine oxidase
MQADTLIVGGGLSGLYLAYRMTRESRSFLLVEARDRLGGRILSRTAAGQERETDARYDLGPAWVWPALQPRLRQLLVELNLPLFPQYTQGAILYEDVSGAAPRELNDPSAHGQSYRLTGGAGRVIERLAAALPEENLLVNRRVVRMTRQGDTVAVEMRDPQGSDLPITARQVVLALPPRLLAQHVEFVPALPASMHDSWIATPTWMAGQAKAVALYATPFWRAQGRSGEAYSRRGPLMEIHDASPARGGPYALFGFVGIAADGRRQLGVTELRRACLAQWRRLFGDDAARPLDVFIKDWADDTLTATREDRHAPAHHPAYGTVNGGRAVWEGQLILAGSETAETHGGYLEGALEAAEAALAHIRSAES